MAEEEEEDKQGVANDHGSRAMRNGMAQRFTRFKESAVEKMTAVTAGGGGFFLKRIRRRDGHEGDGVVAAVSEVSFREQAFCFASGESVGGGGVVDAVWDRGALVAVEPNLRDEYASFIVDRMITGGKMLVVTTFYEAATSTTTTMNEDGTPAVTASKRASMVSGPPHSVSLEDMRALFETRGCRVDMLGSEEVIDTAPPRMREKLTSMKEITYLVTKLNP